RASNLLGEVAVALLDLCDRLARRDDELAGDGKCDELCHGCLRVRLSEGRFHPCPGGPRTAAPETRAHRTRRNAPTAPLAQRSRSSCDAHLLLHRIELDFDPQASDDEVRVGVDVRLE